MKSELEQLIDHYQTVYDSLHSRMKEAADQRDYETAIQNREALFRIKAHLDSIKSLRIPHFKRISYLEDSIVRYQEQIENKLPAKADEKYHQYVKQSLIDQKLKMEEELLTLTSNVQKRNHIDSDVLLEMLDNLKTSKIKEIEIEIDRDYSLMIIRAGDDLHWSLLSKNRSNQFVITPSWKRSKLSEIGFDLMTFKKVIPNFKDVSNLRMLGELSVLFLEIFGAEGDKRIIVKT